MFYILINQVLITFCMLVKDWRGWNDTAPGLVIVFVQACLIYVGGAVRVGIQLLTQTWLESAGCFIEPSLQSKVRRTSFPKNQKILSTCSATCRYEESDQGARAAFKAADDAVLCALQEREEERPRALAHHDA
jgi:hypothetical protein